MDQARYVVAVMMLVSLPPAVGLWYAIHPFARAWRRIGPTATYLVLIGPAVALGWLMWRARDTLLGRDLGAQPALMAAAAAAAAGAVVIARKRRTLLTQRVLVGVPELSRTDKGRLLTTGIYAKTRNPRYLELWLFAFAYVAFANFVGTWVLWMLLLPALQLVVVLEERELRERFGAEYEDYCRRVPRWVPRMATPARRP